MGVTEEDVATQVCAYSQVTATLLYKHLNMHNSVVVPNLVITSYSLRSLSWHSHDDISYSKVYCNSVL